MLNKQIVFRKHDVLLTNTNWHAWMIFNIRAAVLQAPQKKCVKPFVSL